MERNAPAAPPQDRVPARDLSELERLRREVRRLERGGLECEGGLEREVFSTGLPSLDAALPERGLLPGSLLELVAAAPGAGIGCVALPLVRAACRWRDGLVVLVDRYGIWYPPTLAAWGISLDRLLWVRPQDNADACWAIDQALRCPGVSVVWSVLGRVEARWGRRFRVAAETGRTLGIIEGTHERRQAAPLADLRIAIEPCRSPIPLLPIDKPAARGEAPVTQQGSVARLGEEVLQRIARQGTAQLRTGRSTTKASTTKASTTEASGTGASGTGAPPMRGVRKRERGWHLSLEVLRGRGRSHGLKLDLEIDLISGAVKELAHARQATAASPSSRLPAHQRPPAREASGNETPVSGDLVARLANPTPRRRTARA
ncbi:MAG: hypothetical protein R3B96_19220 [Pirellulaceae bacterium]